MIYLDNQATTPLDPRVFQVMQPLFLQGFGNAGSTDTARGRAAAKVVDGARAQLAAAVGASEREIIFTSGATEANNLAILGAMDLQIAKGRPRVLVLASEHKCVLEAAKASTARGGELEVLPVQSDGLLDPQVLADALNDRVGLVSAMAVHNETGVIQNLAEIGQMVQAAGGLYHCDMAQALGKIPVDLGALPINLASFSAHKAYGPQGIGALYVQARPRAHLAAQVHGGGQERGLRSGTLPLALIAGFAKAAQLAAADLTGPILELWQRAQPLWDLIDSRPSLRLNGHRIQRVPTNLNLSINGHDHASVRAALANVEFSRGSACTAEALDPSYVLQAMGLEHEAAAASFRLSLGRFTTQEEVTQVTAMLASLC